MVPEFALCLVNMIIQRIRIIALKIPFCHTQLMISFIYKCRTVHSTYSPNIEQESIN